MSFVLLALASILFAFGLPAVHAHFDSITFSPVEQCGNFTVLFSGGKLPAALPLSLTVVPFNLTPIVIGIADTAWDNVTLKGAAFTFLPFPAGTEFVASLDDAGGNSAASVSDVIKIQSSQNNSCLSQQSQPTHRYTVDPSLSQCEDFQVTYDPSVVGPPTIRAFAPRNTSFYVNESSTDDSPGRTSYTMDAFRGEQVVLLLSDNTGTQEATNLLTIGGDSSSSADCLVASSSLSSSNSTNSQSNKNKSQGQPQQEVADSNPSVHKLSKSAIIAIAVVSTGVVGGLALVMVLWLCREQRRIRRKRLENFEESFLIVSDGRQPDVERTFSQMTESAAVDPSTAYTTSAISPPPRIPLPRTPPRTFRRDSKRGYSRIDRTSSFHSTKPTGFIKDPLYTDSNFDLMTPSSTYFNSSGEAAFSTSAPIPISSIPVPLVSPAPVHGISDHPAALEAALFAQGERSPSRHDSLSSDDIEHILDMATMYSSPTTSMSTIRESTYRGSMLSEYAVHSDQAEENATISSVRSGRSNYLLRPSPAATPTLAALPTGLLTPDTASLRREPPQAQLPSSPYPSPTASRFIPSTDGAGLRPL